MEQSKQSLAPATSRVLTPAGVLLMTALLFLLALPMLLSSSVLLFTFGFTAAVSLQTVLLLMSRRPFLAVVPCLLCIPLALCFRYTLRAAFLAFLPLPVAVVLVHALLTRATRAQALLRMMGVGIFLALVGGAMLVVYRYGSLSPSACLACLKALYAEMGEALRLYMEEYRYEGQGGFLYQWYTPERAGELLNAALYRAPAILLMVLQLTCYGATALTVIWLRLLYRAPALYADWKLPLSPVLGGAYLLASLLCDVAAGTVLPVVCVNLQWTLLLPMALVALHVSTRYFWGGRRGLLRYLALAFFIWCVIRWFSAAFFLLGALGAGISLCSALPKPAPPTE